jgi:hypothetical protein
MKWAIKTAKLERVAEDAFMDMPNLRDIAVRYCRYVSPYVQAGSRSLVEAALADALVSYSKVKRQNEQHILRAYLGALIDHVDTLCEIRISIQTDKGRWPIWDYEQPLYDWMAAHERKALQITKRDKAVASGPVLVKMLSHICTTRDLQHACVDLSNLRVRTK